MRVINQYIRSSFFFFFSLFILLQPAYNVTASVHSHQQVEMMHSSDFYESLLRGRVEAEFFCCRRRAGGGLQAEGSRQGLAHPWLDHRTSIIILPGKGNLSIRHQQEEDEKASNFEEKQQDAGLHRAHHHVSSVCQARTLEKAAGAWPQAQSRDLIISGCKYIVCFYIWKIFFFKETHMSFLNNTSFLKRIFLSSLVCDCIWTCSARVHLLGVV